MCCMYMFKSKQVPLYSLQGGVDCRVQGTGKLVAFSNAKINVKIPCKFVAVNFECQVGCIIILVA